MARFPKGFIGPRLTVKCQDCGNEFSIEPFRIKHGQGKFCSISCKSRSHVSKMHSKRTPEWSEISRRNLSKYHQMVRLDPTSAHQWKGEDASYRTKHQWIERHYGKPTLCEECGQSDPSRMYHWANITGKYKRERSDYKRMCVPCHGRYDFSRNPNDKRRKRERIGA